jgi:hypothetical protein
MRENKGVIIEEVFMGDTQVPNLEWATINVGPRPTIGIEIRRDPQKGEYSAYDENGVFISSVVYTPPDEVFTVNWGDVPHYRVDPPKEGEQGGRNRFDEHGNVIGYETFEWRDVPKFGEDDKDE